MKNLKVISIGFVLMFFVFALHGQTEKGNVLLGGEAKLNFTFQQIDDHEKNTFGESRNQNGLMYYRILSTITIIHIIDRFVWRQAKFRRIIGTKFFKIFIRTQKSK